MMNHRKDEKFQKCVRNFDVKMLEKFSIGSPIEYADSVFSFLKNSLYL